MATRRAAILVRRSIPRPLSGSRTPLSPLTSSHFSQREFLSQPTTSRSLTARFCRDSFLLSARPFSSASGPSNIVLLQSGDQVTAALQKAKDDKLPSIFYFTATWCGPCRAIAPLIEELSHKYAHVTTYKIDIDQEGLGSILSNLQIYSVPTFHFFHDGKKAIEVVGADPARLKDTMQNLYKEA
ncbi:hypothetical protein Cni_G12082 [Canna indica]|uniref:Thioredoxin domain-containing protein n=1 Tax=Canna indica TaxID=4628 RepID=A0AAQ3KB96_9LILI|nr:hypothetical protein Cni_G12082 [Canna indica]